MQIFIQLLSGKTMSMDVQNNSRVRDVVSYINTLGPEVYQGCLFLRAFYEQEHPMVVQRGEVLPADLLLRDMYVNKIIKEVTLLAYL
jgi:hypothetical protein